MLVFGCERVDREDLAYDLSPVVGVGEDVGEDTIILAVENGVNEGRCGSRLSRLGHDSQDREGSELVGTEMRNVGGTSIGEKTIATGKLRLVDQPGEEKCSVRVRGQGDRVEDDRSGNAFLVARSADPCSLSNSLFYAYLLIRADMRTLETCPHTPRAEAILCDVPDPVDHRIVDIVIPRSAEAQRTRANIVAQRIAHERWRERSQIRDYKLPFLVGYAAFDDLLSCPCAVFVDSDHGEMRSHALEHHCPKWRSCPFE